MKDHVVDYMVRKDYFSAGLSHSISEDVIVCAVVGHEGEAAERLHTFASHHHRRTKRELHAFEHVGHYNARGHLDRISERLDLSPEATRR